MITCEEISKFCIRSTSKNSVCFSSRLLNEISRALRASRRKMAGSVWWRLVTTDGVWSESLERDHLRYSQPFMWQTLFSCLDEIFYRKWLPGRSPRPREQYWVTTSALFSSTSTRLLSGSVGVNKIYSDRPVTTESRKGHATYRDRRSFLIRNVYVIFTTDICSSGWVILAENCSYLKVLSLISWQNIGDFCAKQMGVKV